MPFFLVICRAWEITVVKVCSAILLDLHPAKIPHQRNNQSEHSEDNAWRDNPQHKLPYSSPTACVTSISTLSLRYLCAIKDEDGSEITLQLKENGAANYTPVILPLYI